MDRLDLMDLFRRDMTGVEPTTFMHDDNPHPSLEGNPLVFKREDSAFLFKVWMAGRNSAQPEPAGEAQILGFINPKCMPVQEGYACTLNPVQEGQYLRPVFDRTPAAETAIRLLHDQIAELEACDIGPRDLPMPYISREQVLELIGEARITAGITQTAPDEQIVFGCNRCGQTQQTWTAQCVHCNAAAQPQLAVWYGPMPESNGKTNWTVMLHRAGEHFSEGITVERGEYPDRVRYEADRFRHLIGELKDEPCVLDYDADLHSGYAGPQS